MSTPFDCDVCGVGPADGATTYRVNPKGQRGIFRCDEHIQEGAVPEDVQQLVDTIEDDKEPTP